MARLSQHPGKAGSGRIPYATGYVFPLEGVFPDLYQLYERTRQVLMAHQERPI